MTLSTTAHLVTYGGQQLLKTDARSGLQQKRVASVSSTPSPKPFNRGPLCLLTDQTKYKSHVPPPLKECYSKSNAYPRIRATLLIDFDWHIPLIAIRNEPITVRNLVWAVCGLLLQWTNSTRHICNTLVFPLRKAFLFILSTRHINLLTKLSKPTPFFVASRLNAVNV